MKKLIIFFIIFLVIVVASLIVYGPLLYYGRYYIGFSKIIQITDVTKKKLITLVKDERQGSVFAINILITGHIDGAAMIRRYYENSEKPFENIYEIKKGRVRLKIGGDWYSDKCLIEYEPIDVTSGKLQIKYKFKAFPTKK